MSTEKKNIYKSLAGFAQEVPVIQKASKGFNYTYTNLTDIFKVINPLLQKHGLGFTQLLQGDTIETIIFHVESGESITSVVNIPQNVTLNKMNDFQVLGSAITYLRRYAISSALCLVTDADLDACGEQIQSTPAQEIPCDEDKDLLKQLVYNSKLDETKRSAAFQSIADCMNYDQYQKIQHKLEGLQLEYDDVTNPNAGDIKKKVKQMAGNPSK